jgi:hypothetical protein
MAEQDKKIELSGREKYLIENFKRLDEKMVKAIIEIGRMAGTHKYDVWIAKEVLKNSDLLRNAKDFQYIIDWAQKKHPNIMGMDFAQAFKESEEWHKNLKFTKVDREEHKEEDERIIYRCSDGKHFFMLLRPEDLSEEGDIMRNCVGGYTDKVRLGRSLIVSLRDEKNTSHVTIEVDVETGMTLQIRGKGNADPVAKYKKLIVEFAMFSADYGKDMDKEILELLNMKFD